MNANPPAGQQILRFCLAALAAWRVTHLLAAEDGPGGIVVRARSRLGSGPLGELADCFGCLSMWVSIPLVPFVTRRRSEAPVCWLALSGAAFLLERLDLESLGLESLGLEGLGLEGEAERVVTLAPDGPGGLGPDGPAGEEA